MTPINFIIMVISVVLISTALILFIRWESKHATSYFEKKENKRRKRLLNTNQHIDKKQTPEYVEKEYTYIEK
jgi:FtsZ-interacting cell division protein ZipA